MGSEIWERGYENLIIIPKEHVCKTGRKLREERGKESPRRERVEQKQGQR